MSKEKKTYLIMAIISFLVLVASVTTLVALDKPFTKFPKRSIELTLKLPQSFDEAYVFIRDGTNGWQFPTCKKGEVKPPFVNRRSVELANSYLEDDGDRSIIIIDSGYLKEIAKIGDGAFSGGGKVTVKEIEVFENLIKMALAGDFSDGTPVITWPTDGYITIKGDIFVCDDPDNGPTVYGNGVQKFWNWLSQYSENPGLATPQLSRPWKIILAIALIFMVFGATTILMIRHDMAPDPWKKK